MGAVAGSLGLQKLQPELYGMLRTMDRRNPGGNEIRAIRDGVLMRGIRGTPEEKQLKRGENCWEIAFSGRLDNGPELRRELTKQGHQFLGSLDSELVLHAYSAWGRNCLDHFEGPFAFAIWEEKGERLFLARDQMGIEPLFYRLWGGTLIFASEIKTILAVPGVRAELDEDGAAQLLLFGPGRFPGSGVFRDIRELEPGCCAVYEKKRLTVTRYWHLRDREHRQAFQETAETVKTMVQDAIERQMDGNMGTFLSGGLDSSLISAVCGKIQEERGQPLHTFSVDYRKNDLYFEPGKFQPESDGNYIQEMVRQFEFTHHSTVLGPDQLLQELEQATAARDLPGMGDVDFSLMAFCREIRKIVPGALSGECADELFGGYPWFRDPEIRGTAGFPWAQNTKERARLLAHRREDAEDFVMDAYRKTCLECDILPGTPPQDRRIKEMANLNQRWFMQTLLERNDRMRGDLEIRVPFCSYRLAEYLYAVPWEMKDYMGREKGLLRYAAKGLLPERVRLRKKSPYPKTFDPDYENLVVGRLRILMGQESPIWHLIDRDTVREMLTGESPTPWYGQLMRKPQFVAFLLQIDFWLRHYQVQMCF